MRIVTWKKLPNLAIVYVGRYTYSRKLLNKCLYCQVIFFLCKKEIPKHDPVPVLMAYFYIRDAGFESFKETDFLFFLSQRQVLFKCKFKSILIFMELR